MYSYQHGNRYPKRQLLQWRLLQGPDPCIGTGTTLTATGNGSYAWSNNLGNTAVVNITPTATTNYTVTVTATNGCTATTSVTVTVNALPTANAGADITTIAGEAVQLQATGGTTYSWSPATGPNNSNIANPMATVSETTTLTVMACDGC